MSETARYVKMTEDTKISGALAQNNSSRSSVSSSDNGKAAANPQYDLHPPHLELEMQELLQSGGSHRTLSLSNPDFDKISSLLCQGNQEAWSFRPRTYAVLRAINALGLMDDFVQSGCLDIALPYSQNNLPESLSLEHRRQQRDLFLEAQKYVLSQEAAVMENTKGHANFAESADEHFKSLELLGSGGSGSVDRVLSKLSHKVYVRKRLDRQKTFEQSSKAMRFFQREVEALKRLRHHHLVRYVASYTDPQFVGLIVLPVAEYDLRSFLSKPSLNSAERDCIREAFGCLCAAILYLQKKQIRHKDIKPENILIRQQKVYITDFGICRDWVGATRSTTAGEVRYYSEAYAAPEVVANDPRSTSADIWSLGCVYLDMTTVLKGETLTTKLNYFRSQGTGGEYPRNNMEALKGWMDKLKSTTDNAPLEWMKDMMREKRNSRVTPEILMSRIHECDEPRDFYGHCCREQDEGDLPSALRESQSEDFSSSEDLPNDQPSKKKAPDPAAVEKHLCSAARNQDLRSLKTWLRRASRLQQGCLNTLALHIAASNGNEEIVDTLVQFGCNLERKSDDHTPLYEAVQDSREGATNRLIQAKVALNTKNGSRQCTALHLAVRNHFHAGVQALLVAGASTNICDKNQRTPLMSAVKGGCVPCVDLLLKNRANLSLTDSMQMTALHEAICNGNLRNVRMLLDHNAKTSLKDKYGHGAIHVASELGRDEIILELLIKKVDINEYNADLEEGRTPLLCAVHFKRPQTVQLLLDQGADVDLPTRGLRRPNRTPLHCAIELDQFEIFETLLKFSPNVDARDNLDGTPLSLAIGRRRIDYVQRLLAAGADVESKIRLQTALTHATLNLQDLPIAQILIDNGANLETPSDTKGNMLHPAVYHGRTDIVQFLLNNGININRQDISGLTPLMVCAKSSIAVNMRELLPYSPAINLQDNFGRTALHFAVYYGFEEKTSILLEHGAEPLIVDKENFNALGTARRQGHEKIVEILVKALDNAGRMIEDPRWPGMQIFLWPELLEEGYEVKSKNDLPFIYSLRRGQLTETRGAMPPWLPSRKKVLAPIPEVEGSKT